MLYLKKRQRKYRCYAVMKADIILQNNMFEFSTVTKQGLKRKKKKKSNLNTQCYTVFTTFFNPQTSQKEPSQNIRVWIKDTQTNDF